MITALFRSSLEDPTVPLDDASAWNERTSTDAGVQISRERVLGHPSVWAAVQLISRAVARLPLNVMRRDGKGKDHDATHPAYQRLRYNVSDTMTAFQFKLRMTGMAVLGNAYAYIHRNGRGEVAWMRILDPRLTTPVVEKKRLRYASYINNRLVPLEADEVLHLAGIQIDDLPEGKDIVSGLREAFALALGQRQYRALYFKNNGRPNVALELPPEFDEDKRKHLIEDWRRAVSGIQNAHRAVLLDDGVKIHEYGSTVRDSQLLEADEHEVVQIANIFGIPPHFLGSKINTSYKSLEQERQRLLDDGIDPWLCEWEQQCRMKLLRESEKRSDSHVITFNRKAFVQADMKTRYESLNIGVLGGWVKPDEARGGEDYNPLPDGQGEKAFIPNSVRLPGEPLPGAGNPDPQPTDPPADDPAPDDDPEGDEAARQSLREIFRRDTARMRTRLFRQAEAAAKREENFVAWLDRLEEENHRTIAETMAPTASVLFPETDVAKNLIDETRRQLLELAGEQTRAGLPAAIRELTEKGDS